MLDLLDTTRRAIDDRLRELKPLVDEYRQFETAAKALGGVGGRASKRAPANGRRKRRRPRASTTRQTKAARTRKAAAPSKRRPGRRKGTGTRAAEALALVQAQPGIAIPELAAKMGIKQNYLYRVMPGLEKETRCASRTKAGIEALTRTRGHPRPPDWLL
jgi:hypothetical protein